MTNFDASPEAQRLAINLMLAALHRMNRGQLGFGHGQIEDLEVSSELQGQFMENLWAFVADRGTGGLRPGGGVAQGPKCANLLLDLRQEISSLGGVPPKTVQGWRQRFTDCRGQISESAYNEGMSLLEGAGRQ